MDYDWCMTFKTGQDGTGNEDKKGELPGTGALG